MPDDDEDVGNLTFLMIPLPVMLWAAVAFLLVTLGTICVGMALLIHLLGACHRA